MDVLVTAVIAGIGIGCVYGLVAVGYTVIFKATKVFNLAQGDLVMCGVMISYLALDVLRWSELPTFVAVCAAVAAIALVEERFAVRRFLERSSDPLSWFISTLGFSLVIEAVVFRLFGNHPVESIPSPFPSNSVGVSYVRISYQFLATIVALAVVVVLLQAFYHRTMAGRAMRAVAEDRDAARMRGIPPRALNALSFGLGGLVAGVAGFVVAPIVSSDPTIGLNYTVYGFLALAIGGFGSLPGAIVGGIVLGIAEQLFDAYASARYEYLADLAVLFVVLVVRPTGLLGIRGGRRV